MRRALVWGLAASVTLSAWALLNPGSKTVGGGVVAPVERPSVEAGTALEAPAPPAIGRQTDRQGAEASLPAKWPAPNMEAAPRSPFVPPVSPPPKPIASPSVTQAALPPPPPQVTYRFWGSLIAPTGERVLYVARDDNAQPIAVRVGTRLDGGFEVEQITTAAIVLVQSASQQRITLSMSPPPSTGAR